VIVDPVGRHPPTGVEVPALIVRGGMSGSWFLGEMAVRETRCFENSDVGLRIAASVTAPDARLWL